MMPRNLEHPTVFISPFVLAPALAGAAAQGFGVYWDIAFHIDVGRDTFFTPPHLLILGGMASMGLAVVVGLGRNSLLEKAGRTLRPALVASGIGVLVQFVSLAFVDNWWHANYGLDITLWSPPHLLALFGAYTAQLGFLLGVSAELRSRRLTRFGHLLLALFGANFLFSLLVVMAEYEFGFPQFRLSLQPIVLAGLTVFGLSLAREVVGYRFGATGTAAIFTTFRLATWGGLASLERSIPVIPSILLAALAIDLAAPDDGDVHPLLSGLGGVIAGSVLVMCQLLVMPLLSSLPFIDPVGWTHAIALMAWPWVSAVSSLAAVSGRWLGVAVRDARPLIFPRAEPAGAGQPSDLASGVTAR